MSSVCIYNDVESNLLTDNLQAAKTESHRRINICDKLQCFVANEKFLAFISFHGNAVI